MILIFALYAIFAASFTIAKILLNFMSPVLLIAIRMTIAGCLLLTMQRLIYKKFEKIPLRMIPWWIGFATIHIFMPYITEFIALQSISASCSALIFNLTPFFSAFFSYFYFGEKMTRQKWVGFLIGFTGIASFILSQSHFCINVHAAYGLIVLSVIFGALGWIYVRMLVLQGYQPLMINGIAMLVAGIESFGFAYLWEQNATLPWGHMPEFIFWMITIILLTNVIYYNLYARLLKRYTVTLLSFMGCIIPLFTAFFDWLLLGAQVTHHFFIALFIAGYGVYLFYQEELRQGYIKKA
ncbi:DMT family transporter [Candidatus Babeliales bacterium]|nr:DMT family transporter [Candidatus Babeliales bacterium]